MLISDQGLIQEGGTPEEREPERSLAVTVEQRSFHASSITIGSLTSAI